jgi:hypothetical protein
MALERVARRRWAQDKPEPGDIRARMGGRTTHAPTTDDCGKEPHERVPERPSNLAFPRIFADFLGNWT